MSLILPPWYFANEVDSNTGTPDATAPGVNFTAGNTNADGSAVSILSALAFDVHYLVVGIGGINANAANGQCLLDVLTDPAGGTSWGSFIDDLVCGMTPTVAGAVGLQCWYHFPVFIKSGNSVGVRARTRHTSDITQGRVMMFAYGNPSRPEMWWCGSKVESLGINAATSQGTDVTPGNTGTFGSWTTIGTAGGPYGAVQLGVNGSDATAANSGYYWQLGYGSTQLPGSPTLYRSTTTAETGAHSGFCQPIFCSIASGTIMQARATATGVAEVFNAAIYGVY